MISRNIITDLSLITLLIVLQIFLFNRLIISEHYIPVIYPIFVMFYPFYRNKYVYIFLAFLLGLGIDAFLGTWGINAFATCLIAYCRTHFFLSSTSNEIGNFSFQSIKWIQFLFFIFINIFIHQLLVQYLEFFKPSNILKIFINVIFTTLVSFTFILLYVLGFRIKEKV